MRTRAAIAVAVLCACSPSAPVPRTVAANEPAPPSLGAFTVTHLPTGADVTPTAAPGSRILDLDPHLEAHPEFRAGYAVSLALSPDGRTLALLTSGYNQLTDAQGKPLGDARSEYVFFYDVAGSAAGGTARSRDAHGIVQTQVLAIPNAFVGLAFALSGDTLYASGGPDDTLVVIHHEVTAWKIARTIALGHGSGLGVSQGPLAAGLAVAIDGTVVVANHENDSITLVDPATSASREISLRPGGGVAGGEFPLGLAIVGVKAYVAAQRDRELDEVDLGAGRVVRRVAVGGQPVRVLASRDGKRLFVANANTDDVAIVDREHMTIESRIPVGGPRGTLAASLRGASPNALALSPDEKTLYVTLGGANAIAVVSLASRELVGLIPTGFYPNDVAVARDGKMLWCAYGKSHAGPNPKGPWFDDARVHKKPFGGLGGNEFSLQLNHGGLHAIPLPSSDVLALLTARALRNERLDQPPALPPIFAALRGKVRHVIYLIAENRTFDQILGDQPGLDGDPTLVHWGHAITPNQHALAARFTGFDRFFDSGGVSGDGWQWSTAGRATDVAEKEIPLMYASRGVHSYDWEGKNRGINVSLPTSAERRAQNPSAPDDDDLLPGTADVAAVDRPVEGGRGYLWDAAKRAGLRVRNYGFFIDDSRYNLPNKDPAAIRPVREPFESKTRVAYTTALGLADDTDPYFRGFDVTFSDFWRAREWKRELDAIAASKEDLPALSFVRLPHDHLGGFGRALDGVDTPDTQMADHDYALGVIVEALSRSRFWDDTILIALEDDAQDGADHVDAHRSVLFFAGGHAAAGVVSHARYATPSVLRTIELLLGVPPLGRRDAVAPPIADALSESVDDSPFVAVVPDVLRATKLPLPAPKPGEHATTPRGTAGTWERATRGMRFDREDELPAAAFNAVLYCGLIGGARCPR
ncbi:MAG TPA: hypothetical protein VGH28_22735 [Polyangiaceae bacterium]